MFDILDDNKLITNLVNNNETLPIKNGDLTNE